MTVTMIQHCTVRGTRPRVIRDFKIGSVRPHPPFFPGEAEYAKSVEISFVEPGNPTWSAVTVYDDDASYVTIERDGVEVYDSRRDVPVDMDRWNAYRAQFPNGQPLPPGDWE